eukprot:scaffold138681_cov28-Tisochrysis_lutea.AAC.6
MAESKPASMSGASGDTSPPMHSTASWCSSLSGIGFGYAAAVGKARASCSCSSESKGAGAGIGAAPAPLIPACPAAGTGAAVSTSRLGGGGVRLCRIASRRWVHQLGGGPALRALAGAGAVGGAAASSSAGGSGMLPSQNSSTSLIGISTLPGAVLPFASRMRTSSRYASRHSRRRTLPEVVLRIARGLSSTMACARNPSPAITALSTSRTMRRRCSSSDGASGRTSDSRTSTSPSSSGGCTEKAAEQPGRRCGEPRSAWPSISCACSVRPRIVITSLIRPTTKRWRCQMKPRSPLRMCGSPSSGGGSPACSAIRRPKVMADCSGRSQ